MSFLPRLDDEDPSLVLADLSAVSDDSPLFSTHGLPHPLGLPPPSRSVNTNAKPNTFASSSSSSSAGFGSGSGYGGAFGSGSNGACVAHTTATANAYALSSSRSHPPVGSSSGSVAARPRFSLFARPAASGGGAPSRGLGLALGSDGVEAVAEDEEGGEDEGHHEGHGHDEGDEEDDGDATMRWSEQQHGGEGEGDHVDEDELGLGHHPTSDADPAAYDPPAARDERLRASLAELRKFNTVFEGFYSALADSRAHNERVAARVKETHALMDKYIELQGQALHTQDLILNPRWQGSKADEKAAEQAELARLEAEARAREAARIEAERLEAERVAEEQRRADAARVEAARATRGRGAGSGLRGRAGTGIVRPRAAGASTSSGVPQPTTGIPTRSTRPMSGSGSRPTSAAGGKWGHVQSSGYGPSGRRT